MEKETTGKNGTVATGKIAGGAAAGSVLGAFLAASCCVGPPLFALFGVSGMGLIVTFMPHQTEIMAASFVLLGIGFYFAYRKPKVADSECENPRSVKINRAFVWLAAVLVAFFTASPYLRLLLQ